MSYNTQEQIDRVSAYRGLPVIKKGALCEVDGKSGKIVGGNSSANLNVLFDGERMPMNCHPYWRMKIFNADGSVLYESEN